MQGFREVSVVAIDGIDDGRIALADALHARQRRVLRGGQPGQAREATRILLQVARERVGREILREAQRGDLSQFAPVGRREPAASREQIVGDL